MPSGSFARICSGLSGGGNQKVLLISSDCRIKGTKEDCYKEKCLGEDRFSRPHILLLSRREKYVWGLKASPRPPLMGTQLITRIVFKDRSHRMDVTVSGF